MVMQKHTHMYLAALFSMTKRWKQPTCVLTDEWTTQMRFIHIMDILFSLKRMEILAHVTTWRLLEGIRQNKSVTKILCDSTPMRHLEWSNL